MFEGDEDDVGSEDLTWLTEEPIVDLAEDGMVSVRAIQRGQRDRRC